MDGNKEKHGDVVMWLEIKVTNNSIFFAHIRGGGDIDSKLADFC